MESEVLKQIYFQMFLPEPPVSPWATVLPLVLVMGVCMVKQVTEGDAGAGAGAGCDGGSCDVRWTLMFHWRLPGLRGHLEAPQ